MEITINIRQSNKFHFISELLSSFPFIEIVTKTKGKKKKTLKDIQEGDPSVDPNMLFGKWKNLDIDAKTLRRESWKKA